MFRSFFIGTLTALLFSSCGPASRSSSDPGPQPPGEQPGETSPESHIVYATGWQEIEMIANFAKTKMGVAGHFSTSRNACGKEDYGALELDLWNLLAESTNAVVKQGLGTDEYCIKLPEPVPGQYYRVMDGVAEIVLDDGRKLPLFETRGPESCTKISDRQAAAKLLDQLHKIVALADVEGCPNGWGS